MLSLSVSVGLDCSNRMMDFRFDQDPAVITLILNFPVNKLALGLVLSPVYKSCCYPSAVVQEPPMVGVIGRNLPHTWLILVGVLLLVAVVVFVAAGDNVVSDSERRHFLTTFLTNRDASHGRVKLGRVQRRRRSRSLYW